MTLRLVRLAAAVAVALWLVPAQAAVNLALGKPTAQSSTYQGNPGYDGAKGVDGLKYDSSMFHTDADPVPWWEVDLLGVYAIDNVTLYNRVGCCDDRVKGIQVWISTDGEHYDLVYQHGNYVFRNRRADVGGREARYVRVVLPPHQYLHLQEVEVYQYGTWQPPAERVPVLRSAGVGAIGGPGRARSTAQGATLPAWEVVEKDLSNGKTWTATWTVGADGRSFDADWTAQHSGEHGVSRNVAQLVSIDGDQIRVDRPGLGTYTGTISSDRKHVSGRSSWCNCSWQVTTQVPLPQRASTLASTGSAAPPATAPAAPTAPATPVATPAPAAGRVPYPWEVVEKDLTNGKTWTSTWTAGSDGRSFDCDWRAVHSGEHGVSRNLVQLGSIVGDQIRVDRPGLGTYTGTISRDRKHVSGRTSWCNCSWEVTLPEPLPDSFGPK